MSSVGSPVVLVINPGSTSTKIGVYDGPNERFVETIRYRAEQIAGCATVFEQFPFRLADVQRFLADRRVTVGDLDIVMARGGALRPVHGGSWAITDAMLEDLRTARYADHASSLGALIAHALVDGSDPRPPIAVTDPPVTDELDDVARLTGHPRFHRLSRFHALNHKAVAHRAAAELGKRYEASRLIVAHLGGGISIGVHRDGRVVDVNDAYDGAGPFSPERSGTLPVGQVVDHLASGAVTAGEMKRFIVGEGGLVAHLGTNDVREVETLSRSGGAAARVLDAMVYQIAKEIGAAATVLMGELDAVVITGSIANSERIVQDVQRRIAFLGRIIVYPGEDELTALRDAALRILAGEETPCTY